MLGGTFDKNKLKDKIKIFDKKISQENFWKDKLTAQKTLKEKKFFGNILENLSDKDRLRFYDSENKKTILKFY